VVLSFSCSEPSHVCIEADPFVFGMGIFDLSTFQQCRTEVNLQCVAFAIFEVLRNVYPVRDEHIVAFQDSLPIDLDGRKRVKAIKNKLMNLAVSRGSNFWKYCPIRPTLVRDPFTFEFVKPKKGVRDSVVLDVSVNQGRTVWSHLHVICDQIKMYIGGYSFYWHPVVQVGLFEFP
jgi:hypothetical protein